MYGKQRTDKEPGNQHHHVLPRRMPEGRQMCPASGLRNAGRPKGMRHYRPAVIAEGRTVRPVLRSDRQTLCQRSTTHVRRGEDETLRNNQGKGEENTRWTNQLLPLPERRETHHGGTAATHCRPVQQLWLRCRQAVRRIRLPLLSYFK